VLTPVSAEQTFEQDLDQRGFEAVRDMIAAQWSQMAVPLLGFPAIAVPTGLAGGLPTGVQLIGRRFGEEDVLRAAEAIEARAGRITPVDPFGGPNSSMKLV
jgi:amidase